MAADPKAQTRRSATGKRSRRRRRTHAELEIVLRAAARSRSTATSPPAIALQLAKRLKRNPRELARSPHFRGRRSVPGLRQALCRRSRSPGPASSTSASRPAPSSTVDPARARSRRELRARAARPSRETVQVEFVSANPDRAAARRPRPAGGARRRARRAPRSAGRQGHARVLLQRRRRADPEPRALGAGARARAQARRRRLAGRRLRRRIHRGDCQGSTAAIVDDLEAIRKFAVDYLRKEQDIDLREFGVKFDVYYLESSLYTDGKVDEVVKALVASGKTYEKDGALWLRTTDYGDDKDRVIRKSDGTLHLLRARRRLPPHQVAARLRQGDQRAGHRPHGHDGARARRPAGARTSACRRAIRTTCCTAWCG